MMTSLRYKLTAHASIAALLCLTALGCANYEKTGTPDHSTNPKTTIHHSLDKSLQRLLPQDLRDDGTISIAINPDVPPVKFLGSDNKVKGLIVDLLEGAATRLGLEVKWQRTSFEALIPGLVAERFDIIASAGDFKERQKKVDFIDYVVTGVSLLVLKGNPHDIHSPADLCGMEVAFVRGTAQETLIDQQTAECKKQGKKPVMKSGYKDSGGAELALRSGQADVDWTDSPDARYRAKQRPDTYEVAHTVYTGPYGIGFPKDRPKMTKAFRSALRSMSDDHTYQATMKQYGMGGKNAMPKFPMNQGVHRGEDWG